MKRGSVWGGIVMVWGGIAGWWPMMEGLTPCTGLPQGVIHLHLHGGWNHAVVSLLQYTM